MAHYAFLDDNNSVTDVITGIDETNLIEGLDPETWYGNLRGQVCRRTSYNTVGGVHTKGDTAFRKNYAGIGYTFDSEQDAFIPPKPYPSWILNEDTCLWDSPVPRPEGEDEWIWNEATLTWIKQELN